MPRSRSRSRSGRRDRSRSPARKASRDRDRDRRDRRSSGGGGRRDRERDKDRRSSHGDRDRDRGRDSRERGRDRRDNGKTNGKERSSRGDREIRVETAEEKAKRLLKSDVDTGCFDEYGLEMAKLDLESKKKKDKEKEEAEESKKKKKAMTQQEKEELALARLKKNKKHHGHDRMEKKVTSHVHWREKELKEMNERDWRIFGEDFDIVTKGQNCPFPLRYWGEAEVPEEIFSCLKKAGYKRPSPIQRAAIPIGLAGRDMVGIAQTGSGKTVAFLIPLLCYLYNLPRLTDETSQEGPYAIVLAPTRELALQISQECDKFAKSLNIRAVSIIGGLSIQDQGVLVREGAEVVIATPGRIADCIKRRYLVLNQCHYMVLDEADRMIDMNFEPQIITIMESMPLPPETQLKGRKHRTTLLFSATMPTKVRTIAKKYLTDPIYINIGSDKGQGASTVEHRIEWITQGQKMEKLISILQRDPPPFIVFLNNRKDCDKMVTTIKTHGLKAISIHGGKPQDQRMESLQSFKNGDADILVGTDVVGRGIDVEGVAQVINFDMPKNIELFTHRTGRTGRAGKSGIATSFCMQSDDHIFADLKNFLEQANAVIPQQLSQACRDTERQEKRNMRMD
eukprot:gb/GEZN01004629.1/.p1 GENE.gb/GEZN01004629.1/~~gb/GEZN01004629.1/.p1  ORF type:complete len:623 (-),score=75.19 gb/GEZN01004629.1/:20-1888(-)